MQFYLNGYQTGDPFIQDPYPAVAQRPKGLPEDCDVLIVGCGPAGLVTATQLANFPEIRTVVIDRKDGPLQVGQADGVACRTVEMFEAFGLADRLLNEGYRVNETCFWRPDPDNPSDIQRTGHTRDTEEGLSEFPHTIVNQARMLAFLRDYMQKSASKLEPFYGLHSTDVKVDTSGSSEYPVTATLLHMKQEGGHHKPTGQTSTIRAKYVVGCDGSHSDTRTSIGRELVGDMTNQSWGVMDVLAVTDFPDIRRKCAIYSADEGNILLIPREGGYLVRFYVELDKVRDKDMVDNRSVTPEKLAKAADRILRPYTLEVKSVGWWSVYEIGQRLCDKFDDVPTEQMATRLPRVFILGDACHTHSAAAGQGMNVSMQDAWNLGWKLGTVLRGTARPELLHTYSAERQKVAQELINFDRKFSGMLSAQPGASGAAKGLSNFDPEEFQQYFVAQGRFTAGTATQYGPSMIIAEPMFQHFAEGFPIGMRFHSAPVLRVADVQPVQLGHAARADGAWRTYIFADHNNPTGAEHSRAKELCEFLASDASPITRFTPAGANPDSVIDIRAIFQQGHHELAIDKMPSVLLPKKGKFGQIDYEKIFCPDPEADNIFDLRGVNRETGCMVIVRPDQYVAHILPLQGHTELADFFAGILIDSE